MDNGALLAISPREGLDFAWTVGWTCFQTGRWEAHVERCIRQLLRPGDTAIDVGANLGYFSAVMAQCVEGHGRVWSFEPVPPTFERLCLSLSLNGFRHVTPLAVALGDAGGTARIVCDPCFAGSASFHGSSRGPHDESHQVPVHRLDDLLEADPIGPVRLIKIDVEGHELAVMRGARQTIAQAKPSIVFEFSESLARSAGWTLPEIGQLLAACADYHFYEIHNDGLRAIGDLSTYAAPPDAYGVDLLATCEVSALTPEPQGW